VLYLNKPNSKKRFLNVVNPHFPDATPESKRKTDNGYLTIKRTYTCTECVGCPFQSSCAKDKEVKSIQVSMVNQKQRQEVKERLTSEEGKIKYKQRKIDVEPVFGQIKYNNQFQRFLLRGLQKTTVEWDLICAGHNLKKWEMQSRKYRN